VNAPLVYRWDGEAMQPFNGRFAREADRQFAIGGVYCLGEIEERSTANHNHEFAWLKDAWVNLPETVGANYPSAEFLRKMALINTGWCTVRDYPCASRPEAGRLHKMLAAELDEYAVVVTQDAVVRVLRAKSQARNKMNAADFKASKQAILEWVSALIETTPEQLSTAARDPARPTTSPVAAA